MYGSTVCCGWDYELEGAFWLAGSGFLDKGRNALDFDAGIGKVGDTSPVWIRGRVDVVE